MKRSPRSLDLRQRHTGNPAFRALQPLSPREPAALFHITVIDDSGKAQRMSERSIFGLRPLQLWRAVNASAETQHVALRGEQLPV